MPNIAIVIPALDEEGSIADVVRRCRLSIGSLGSLRVIVSDNGSRDATAGEASRAGAEVVAASARGYGSACLRGMSRLGDWPDVVLFVDGDGSSLPEEIPRLIAPLLDGTADLVLGVRPENAVMTLPQKWGTRLAVRLVNLIWRARYQDMGPFRGLSLPALHQLGMKDLTWGWTIEMQIRSAELGLRTAEVPVSWQQRQTGRSKISGTVSGVTRAGCRILWTIARQACKRFSPGRTQSLPEGGKPIPDTRARPARRSSRRGRRYR